MLTKFDERRIEAEILGELYRVVEEKESGAKRDYRKVGVSDEQDKDWRTGELLWEDEEKTIPKMRDKWDYVAKEELTEEEELYLQVCHKIKSALEKMI